MRLALTVGLQPCSHGRTSTDTSTQGISSWQGHKPGQPFHRPRFTLVAGTCSLANNAFLRISISARTAGGCLAIDEDIRDPADNILHKVHCFLPRLLLGCLSCADRGKDGSEARSLHGHLLQILQRIIGQGSQLKSESLKLERVLFGSECLFQNRRVRLGQILISTSVRHGVNFWIRGTTLSPVVKEIDCSRPSFR